MRRNPLILTILLISVATGLAAVDLRAATQEILVATEYALPDGGGTDPEPPRSMVVFEDRLVLHGPFTGAGGGSVDGGPVAWTGTEFSASGLPGQVTGDCQTVSGGLLHYDDAVWDGVTLQPLQGTEPFAVDRVWTTAAGASGLIMTASVLPPTALGSEELLHWDGSEWLNLATCWGDPTAMLEFEGQIFVGGITVSFDAIDYYNGLRWDGAWHAHPELPRVHSFVEVDGELYATTADGLWQWTGSIFEQVSGTDRALVLDAVAYAGGLAIGGRFEYGIDGHAPGNVAFFDGAQWSALPRLGHQSPDFYPDGVLDLEVFQGELYAAGTFDVGTQPEPAAGFARLVNGTWVGFEATVGFGFAEPVHEIGVHQGELFVGTNPFNLSGAMDGSFVRETNGWREVSSTLRDRVKNFESTPEGLVAVGFRYRTGTIGTEATIERFVADEWQTLAVGSSDNFDASVNVALHLDGELVVAGDFDYLDGVPHASIAAFDGTSWRPLGPGFDDEVHDLIEFQGDLIAIGDMWSSGGVPVYHVARWDGASWSSVGAGFSQYGLCLEIVDGALYAGGAIQYSGANYVPYLARWDGVEWVGVAGGPNKVVEDMAGVQGGLYLTGNFTTLNGVAVDGFGKLDHATQLWEKPEFLPNGAVNALFVDGSDLYLGGDFTEISTDEGTIVSERFARVRFVNAVSAPDATASRRSRIADAYPNPANPKLHLVYDVAQSGRVELVLFDARGRQVRTLRHESMTAGRHTTTWDGRDDRGRRASSGVYFARLVTADGSRDTKKIVLAQ